MTMLYLFLSLFAFQLLLVAPGAIKKEQVENREDSPSLVVNITESHISTITESADPKTTEAPWSHVDFPPEKAQHEVDTCRKVVLYVSFAELGYSEILAPDGFNAYQCKGKCSPTQRKKFPNRSTLMAWLEKKKGIQIDGEACCVPTKLAPISVLSAKNGNVVLETFDDMVVEECGCE